jgi:hypothetical protein
VPFTINLFSLSIIKRSVKYSTHKSSIERLPSNVSAALQDNGKLTRAHGIFACCLTS